MLCQPGRLAASAAALAVVAGLFMWRVEAVEPMPLPRLLSGEQDVLLPTGLSRLDDALFIAGKDTANAGYFGQHSLRAGSASFINSDDLKTYPIPGGFMVVPLRPFPAVPSTFTFAPGVTLDTGFTPVLAHQKIAVGAPCWVWRRSVCQYRPVVPLPARAAAPRGQSR